MSIPLLSKKMKAIANNIVGEGGDVYDTGINIDERPTHCYYDILCKFTGRRYNTMEEFIFYPTEIKSLIIKQDFVDSYLDHIDLECKVSMNDFIDLYENYRDLKCTLIIRHMNMTTNEVDYTDPILMETYMCIIKNKENLFLNQPKSNLVADSESEYSQAQQSQLPVINFQLMHPTDYDLRKKMFNFILRKSTVMDAMLECAKLCGVEKVCIVPPDNTEVYDNLIVPPTYKFSNVFGYLQNKYGVYNHGLSYYFTNNTLYVYPPYNTKQITPVSAHFYYVGKNNYAGLQRYHALSEKVAHIVTNFETRSKDLVETGAEQLGTALYVQHADRMHDDFFHVDNNEKLHVHENNMDMLINSDDTIGIVSNMYNPEFTFDMSNMCQVKSRINFFRRTVLTTGWSCAVPYMFKPGWVIHYHYDNEDKTKRSDGESISDNLIYASRQGIVDIVNYVLGPVGRRGDRYLYACNADLQLSVEMEEAKDVSKEKPQVNTLSSSNDTTNTSSNSSSRLF